ncbi:MAG: hypothetical protein H0X45_16370, partial [Planctomycetes bacterium]|nr:hypothetical protein [Planctomycetota bacterium]
MDAVPPWRSSAGGHAGAVRLVIVESPNKTAKIRGFLGPGYQVAASYGHVRDL